MMGRGQGALAAAVPQSAVTGADTSFLISAEEKGKNPVPQKELDDFRAALSGGRATGILPLKVAFPALGPSLFLVPELTAENQSPSAGFNFQREKKAGAQ